jgi:TonB family protein
MNRTCTLLLLLLTLLAALSACRRPVAPRYLVVTETTHFELRNGSSLRLPLFAGTLGTEKIVHDVSQAEHYFGKLSAVYGQRSFVFLADSIAELVLPKSGPLASPQVVFTRNNSASPFTLALVAFSDSIADYRFTARDSSGQEREHRFRVPVGQSASIGMLLGSEPQRGLLLAVSVRALPITADLNPEQLRDFLRAKNAPDSTFRPEDQRVMTELFGARAIPLPLPAQDSLRRAPFDVAPFPIGGMNALGEHIVYPPTAIRDSLEGRVVVDVTVSDRGVVLDCRVIKSVRADLDSAALAAVRPVRFSPAQYQGKPVAVHVAIPFAFQLKR